MFESLLSKAKIITVILLVMIFVYLFSDYNLCYLKGVIGIPCPGCGITRALLSATKLHFAEAFYWHPLWLLFAVTPMIFLLKGVNKRFYSSNKFWLIIFFIFMITYAIRMTLMFPDTPPMDFNQNSIMIRAIRLII